MQIQIEHAQRHREHDFDPEQRDECEEVLVVPLPDAGAQPHAMVVVPEHAVVADVAVRGPRRPKDLAGLAEFEFEKLVLLLINSMIKDPRAFICLRIPLGDLLLRALPRARRDDAWVRGRRPHQVIIDQRNQRDVDMHQHLVGQLLALDHEVEGQADKQNQRNINHHKSLYNASSLRPTHAHDLQVLTPPRMPVINASQDMLARKLIAALEEHE